MFPEKKKKKWRPTISEKECGMVSDERKHEINKGITSLINDPKLKEFSFPSTFSNIDRKLAHSLAQENGLKSKSKGTEPNRVITVYKSVQFYTNNCLALTIDSTIAINRLLNSYPVTNEDHLDIEAKTAPQISETLEKRSQLSQGKLLIPRTNMKRTQTFREILPIWSKTDEILSSIETCRVTLIVGETGSGKTTQVPQIIMEYAEQQMRQCQIICAMPRRVAAITICERVSFERGEPLGQTVGYQIRLDSRTSPQTILTYCTNGILLRSLLGGDQWLDAVTHIIIDEVHERDKLTDFNLIVLKNALLKYKNLKLILMSATIDCEKFKNYFKDCPFLGEECGVVQVSGKMYDVKEIYLEHILEGSEYMSPEMRLLKEEKDAQKFFEGNILQDVSSQRTYSKANVPSVEEQIAMLDLGTRNETDRILGTALNTGTTEDLKNLVGYMHFSGIPVDYQHPECGRTALMAAAIHSNIDAVDDLIHMDPDLSVESNEGKTALMYAEEAGDVDILEWFDAYLKYSEQKKVNASSAPLQEELQPAIQEMVELYEKCHIGKDIDENLILCILKTICADGREGAVLVFLPGYDHILCVRDVILKNLNSFNDNVQLDLHILHSRMKSVDQRKVFDPPPRGHRKVILSTNIAETSITINDVVFVIDCGKVKEQGYNTMNGAYILECDWISQSCAQQRKGRAGRTMEGICFRLYTKKRFLAFNPFKIPELLREPIVELCLQAKQLAPTGTSIAEFLGKAIDPPLPDVTKNSIDLLKKMEALNENEDLTILGRHLLQIPVDPRFGKMIVYAILLKCVDPVLTIVCCLSSGEIFKVPLDPGGKDKLRTMRLDLSENSLSDHMVYLNTFREWESAARRRQERRWCQENFISAAAMEMISGVKEQIRSQLKLNMAVVNQNAGNLSVVKAAITAGLYPNIAKIDLQRKFLQTPKEVKVLPHTSSVLKYELVGKTVSARSLKNLPSDWVLFEESHESRTIRILRTCTVISPLTVCLFAGPSQLSPASFLEAEYSNQEEDGQSGIAPFQKFVTLCLDEFIRIHISGSSGAEYLQKLRIKWHSLLARSMNSLGNSSMNEADELTLSTVVSVLKNEDIPHQSANPKEADSSENTHLPTNTGEQSFWQRHQYEYPRAPQQNWRKDLPREGNLGEASARDRGRVKIAQTNWRRNQIGGNGFEASFRGRGRGRNTETEQWNEKITGNRFEASFRGGGRGRNTDQWKEQISGAARGRDYFPFGSQKEYGCENDQRQRQSRGAARGRDYFPSGLEKEYDCQNDQRQRQSRGNRFEASFRGGGRGRNTDQWKEQISGAAGGRDYFPSRSEKEYGCENDQRLCQSRDGDFNHGREIAPVREEDTTKGKAEGLGYRGRGRGRGHHASGGETHRAGKDQSLSSIKDTVLEWKKIRYFLIKKGSTKLVIESLKQGFWAVTEETAEKLLVAKKYSEHVFLIFFVTPSLVNSSTITLQGYAKLGSDMTDVVHLSNQTKDLTRVFGIEWRVRDFLEVKLSENPPDCKAVLELADGEELEERLARIYLVLWDSDYKKRTGQRRSQY